MRQGKFFLILVYLAEVENLVYQIEQTGSIAMNHLQLSAFTFISFFSDHTNQRRDNQGERSTEFMTHIGEEVELEDNVLLGAATLAKLGGQAEEETVEKVEEAADDPAIAKPKMAKKNGNTDAKETDE